MTNIQPLVITDITPSDRHLMQEIVNTATVSPRTLILVKHRELMTGPSVTKIETNLDDAITQLDWIGIGNAILKEEMLNG